MARTGAYPDVGGHATAYRPPGYTYVLGAVYAVVGRGHARITVARLVQAGIGTGIVALLGLLGRRLFGRAAALATMALAAVYLPLIAVGAALLSEPQAAVLEVAALLCVLTWRTTGLLRWAVAAGVAGGALTLTRSNGFVLLAALGVGLWAGRPRLSGAALRPVLAMLGAAVAVVAPWAVRNAVVMRSFIPVSDEAGGTLAGTYNPVSAHDRAAPAYWHLLSQIPSYQTATRTLAAGPEPPFQSRLLHLALDYVGSHPAYVFTVAGWNTLRVLDLTGLAPARYTAGLAGITSPAVADGCAYCLWTVLALALVGLAVPGIRRRVPGFVWIGAVLLFLTVVLVNGESPRLRIPLDPFILLLGGAGLAHVAEQAQRAFRRRPRRGPGPAE